MITFIWNTSINKRLSIHNQSIYLSLSIYLSSIYIKNKDFVCVCLFVIHAFGHDTIKCNEILQAISFRPGGSRRVVFNLKFSSQGYLPPPIVEFTTINTFPESLCVWLLSKQIDPLSHYIWQSMKGKRNSWLVKTSKQIGWLHFHI